MDLSTNYLGLTLRSPLAVSSCPLAHELHNLRRMEDAGAGAVVLWSLFEEQIEHDAKEVDFYLEYGTERFAESITYFPKPHEYKYDSEQYLEYIAKAKKTVDIPIIASLNGVSTSGWVQYAQKMQQAGADAIELNIYFLPTDPMLTSRRVEETYFYILKTVKAAVTIPVSMKLSPFFSSMANMATSLATSGADGLVLFNRFYQPDIDVQNLEVVPNVVLSTSADCRLPQRWVAILYGKTKAHLAASSGIHTATDVAKVLLAGADVAMVCSSLLINGIEHLGTLRKGLEGIMEQGGYESVSQMRGVMSQKSCPDPAAFERANYMQALTHYGGYGVATLE